MPRPPTELTERLQRIDWLVLDVDGVLTSGGVTYDDAGRELKTFHVRDGFGLRAWHFAGKHSALITGRESKIVTNRAAELGIHAVYQGCAHKIEALSRLQSEFGCGFDRACAVGDDIPDLGVLKTCGLAVAVADAVLEVREAAEYVTEAVGGCGAVREVVELILKAQRLWPRVLTKYSTTVGEMSIAAGGRP
jgi:3-deoxy-D-manno-octulosonate 8-phosphate phosphatase (KDO 8-P phosphatase)